MKAEIFSVGSLQPLTIGRMLGGFLWIFYSHWVLGVFGGFKTNGSAYFLLLLLLLYSSDGGVE